MQWRKEKAEETANSGECRRQRRRRRRRKGRGRAVRQREWQRPVAKGSCSPLMNNGPSFFPLFLLFSFSLSCGLLSTKINRIEM